MKGNTYPAGLVYRPGPRRANDIMKWQMRASCLWLGTAIGVGKKKVRRSVQRKVAVWGRFVATTDGQNAPS